MEIVRPLTNTSRHEKIAADRPAGRQFKSPVQIVTAGVSVASENQPGVVNSETRIVTDFHAVHSRVSSRPLNSIPAHGNSLDAIGRSVFLKRPETEIAGHPHAGLQFPVPVPATHMNLGPRDRDAA